MKYEKQKLNLIKARLKNPNFKIGKIIKNCLQCGKEIRISRSVHLRGRGKFCCKKCSNLYVTGVKNPLHSERMRGRKNSEESKVKVSEKLKNIGHKPPSAKGIKRSVTFRKNASERMKGEKCNFWKGGLSKENQIIRHSLEYKLFREAVLLRDNYTCRFCGVKSTKGNFVLLEVDHIKPFSLYPELRFAIDNGRSLCVPCHKTTDSYLNNKMKRI